jgi:hypothetical protein
MRMCALIILLFNFFLPTFAAVKAPNGTDTDPLNLAPDVQVAYQHFYDLDYGTAQTLFEKIAAENPADPMATDYVLNTAVFRELYRLDLLDTTLYVQEGFLSGKHPVVENMQARAHIDALYQHALDLSNRRLAANPNDADALFARGFATSLETLYIGMVEKKYVTALHMASASRKDDDAVLKLDPKYVDCYLIVGVHDYVMGSLSFPLKVLAGLVGIRPDSACDFSSTRGQVHESARRHRRTDAPISAQFSICLGAGQSVERLWAGNARRCGLPGTPAARHRTGGILSRSAS